MDQQNQTAATTGSLLPPHPADPFSQFQGFSAASGGADHLRPRFGVYGYRIPEENISPRMPIPNPLVWKLPRPRLLHSHDEEELTPSPPRYRPSYGPTSYWPPAEDLHLQPESIGWPDYTRGIEDHSLLYSPTPPAIWCNEDLNSLDRVPPMCRDCLPLPAPCTTAPHHTANTFRVPSDSDEPDPLGSNPYNPFAHSTSPPFHHSSSNHHHQQHKHPKAHITIPSTVLDEGASTIYPDDSVSNSNSLAADAAASASQPPHDRTQSSGGDLAEAIVEVHDICLAATQRYLEALRVNWDLRNGRRPVSGGDAVRHRQHGRGGRWAPYKAGAFRQRRRAYSEGCLEGFAESSQHDDGGVRWKQKHQQQLGEATKQSPIPEFTNSLLQNIHYICELIWRRAQRDREDVLGAEAKGCRKMALLHECGESIVLYNAEEGEKDPEGCLEQVIVAGREICRMVGYKEGCRLLGGREDGEDRQW